MLHQMKLELMCAYIIGAKSALQVTGRDLAISEWETSVNGVANHFVAGWEKNQVNFYMLHFLP